MDIAAGAIVQEQTYEPQGRVVRNDPVNFMNPTGELAIIASHRAPPTLYPSVISIILEIRLAPCFEYTRSSG